MTRISRKRLKKEAYLQIHDRFIRTIIELKKMKEGRLFLNELLTPAERIMLAKRLAIIVMLLENISFYRIYKTLKVSPSTVARIWRKLRSGEFSYIKTVMSKKKNREAVWQELEVLIRFGLPPMGRGRWKWLYDLQRK
jgi:uncharacterized protein YerC